MLTIGLGLIAAFAWGLHDVLVRYVSQRTPILSALLTVLVAGSAFQAIGVIVLGDYKGASLGDFGFAALAGLFFVMASISLYKAFEIGPVRLVSPLIASFAVFAVLWGALNGQAITALQWLAICAVLLGVSIVAILSDDHEDREVVNSRKAAISWSLLASLCFAATFEYGQSAVGAASDMLIILVTRLTAVFALLGIMLKLRKPLRPDRKQLPTLCAMGLLDTIALGCVFIAGNLQNANFATVSASAFGMVTVVLARIIFKESMSPGQWAAVALAFCGIGFLSL
ncbi:MAG: DMT family transporter [Amylibacter sp.]